MAAARNSLSTEQHEHRAARHLEVAEVLTSASQNGWAAVCYFYAAYHLATAALAADPIFDNPTDLSRVHVELTPDDRYTTRHKGRKNTANGREWGVGELVQVLYGRAVSGQYERLHQASIDVRYKRGLAADIAAIKEAFERVEAAYRAGELVYVPKGDRT